MRALPILLLCLVAGCNRDSAKPHVTAEKPKTEADLAFTQITKTAYEKLGIKTQPAVVKEVQERLTLTGWIMAKPGHEVTLTAPAAGYVRLAKSGILPVAGDTVAPEAELLRLQPVLSPGEQIQVNALKRSIESELKKAETTLTTAKNDYERIKKLFDQKLRSEQDYELARKARDHAQEEFDAAKDKAGLFNLAEMSIVSPRKGTVLQTHVSAGQYVSAAAPLVTVVDLQPIWIRVPVPEFDLPRIDPKAKVHVSWKNPSREPFAKASFFVAEPTGRVAQIDPQRHTADLWYELAPTKDTERFVKDQMVTVQVPIGRTLKAAVLPYSALVFDVHGHAWIYIERPTKEDERVFERRPVELVGAEDENVIVRANLTGGEPIVTTGAAVLFSRDFHKTPAGEDDDD